MTSFSLQSKCCTRRRTILAAMVAATLGGWCSDDAYGQDIKETVDAVAFNRDIRPILSDRCFACHGPDEKQRQADLRLDTQDGLFGSEDGFGVVTPGDPDDSELLRRLETDDAVEKMPPPDSNKSLSPEEILTIRRWIEQGAPWQGHWSFEPIRRVEPPNMVASESNQRFQTRAIDRFVLSVLATKGLDPAAPADSRTLARRLYLDLLGLPPTFDQVESFAADFEKDPGAYERLVDQLLASPHFGERMAVWWLDLVRYADSVGYHGDQSISVSPFRDYVIRSFNQNKPFDTFAREQLAGDLLEAPSSDQLIASGYNRLGMMSAEGGVQDKEYLAKYIAERVRNLGGAWLGVTLECCECHDHKFDPFRQKDFYAFEAFFADIEERGLYSGANDNGDWGPRIKVPTPEQEQELTWMDQQIATAQAKFEAVTPDLTAAQSHWVESIPPWTTLAPQKSVAANGSTLSVIDDQSILVSGESPATEVYSLEFSNLPAATTALRLEVMPDDSLPSKGPGRAGNGNFVLTEFSATVRRADSGDTSPVPLKFTNASATFEQANSSEGQPNGKFSITSTIDGDVDGDQFGWAVAGQTGKVHRAVFMLEQPLTLAEGEKLVIELKQSFANPHHTLGRFRIDAIDLSEPPIAGIDPPRDIEWLAAIPESEWTPEQSKTLDDYFRSVTPLLEDVRDELRSLRDARKKLDDAIVTTPITKSREPRTVRVLHRGNWMDESGEIVAPAIPAILGGDAAPTEVRLNRLDLANWVVAESNPLTARTLVNRLWTLFFGEGLSTHLGDLGAQGDWPSHPELLDWLASELVDSGWDVKRLIKTIVMSETYRQSSVASPGALERDPYNRWLSHQGSWRLDAEFVRDVVLASSGLLQRDIGGPSVKPYQPPGYWAYLNFPQREWQTGEGADIYRRGLYTHWQRQYLHPSLAAFDAPSREECVFQRPRSNTPLQALALLNDPSYVEAAKALAARALKQGGENDAARLQWIIQSVLTRPARDEEISVLSELLAKHRQQLQGDEKSALEIAEIGAFQPDESLDRVELAAWTSVARTLLNLHETITRY